MLLLFCNNQESVIDSQKTYYMSESKTIFIYTLPQKWITLKSKNSFHERFYIYITKQFLSILYETSFMKTK